MNNQLFNKLILILYCGFTFSLYSQNGPTGIYVSAGPTNEKNSSVKYSNAHFDFVEGKLVRIEWSALEPTDDIFDWAMVQGQIDSANYYGKKYHWQLAPAGAYLSGSLKRLKQQHTPQGQTLQAQW